MGLVEQIRQLTGFRQDECWSLAKAIRHKIKVGTGSKHSIALALRSLAAEVEK
jgi:hypothetical protein